MRSMRRWGWNAVSGDEFCRKTRYEAVHKLKRGRGAAEPNRSKNGDSEIGDFESRVKKV